MKQLKIMAIAVICTVILAGCNGCSFMGTSADNGSALVQAIQLDKAQTMLVVSVKRQVHNLCDVKKIPDNICSEAQTDYNHWRDAQIAVKDGLKAWSASGDASAYNTAINVAIATADDFMNLVSHFVNEPSGSAPPPAI